MGNDIREAQKKAKAWYRHPDLVTEPETVPYAPPSAVVHIGQLVAIEYLSDKFDGKERVYRHELDSLRDLMISPDGKTLVILPGLRVTTRGLEG